MISYTERLARLTARPTPPEPGSDGVAVVGMAGRFPGADDLAAFWDLVVAGRSAVRDVPPGRWPGASPRRGGFLDQIDRFDPAFFGMSATEAVVVDPQQRLFLEEAWNALEDAGFGRDRVAGRAVGVFAGALHSGYDRVAVAAPPEAAGHMLFGNTVSLLAARIAYFLDLRGPALTIDTACSSSLVAIDRACRSILSGECEAALAGGVTVFPDEAPFGMMTRAGMLAPDGRCKPFDDAADGIGVGEAVGVVVLKRLDRALADGDRVRAVIRGSGVNQDGRSNGITAPNPRAQADLLAAVYRRAGVDPRTVTLVEAHGTGTPLGDPIEFAALAEVYGGQTGDHGFCRLGSVKGNIGHTSAAAGVVGLIKAVLCLEHQTIPPLVPLSTPNRRLALAGSPFRLPTSAERWDQLAGSPRRVAVSSFGVSGTNAHAVLEEAPLRSARPEVRGSVVVPVSARTVTALRLRCADLVRWLRGPGAGVAFADVAGTLAAGRTHFEHRVAVVAGSTGELADKLAAVAEGGVPVGLRPPRFAPDAAAQARFDAALTGPPDRLHDTAAGYTAGYDLAWDRVFPPGSWVPPSLPAYPFERQSYWPVPGARVPQPAVPEPAEVPAPAAYRVTWVPVEVSERRPTGGPVAVVAARESFGLAAEFRAAGATVLAFDPDGPGTPVAELEAFAAALPAAADVVFLAFRPVPERVGFTPPGRGDVVTLFRLVRVLSGRPGGGRLTVVTNDLYPVAGSSAALQPWSGAVVGLAKAAGREFPTWAVRVFDLASAEAGGTEWVARLAADPGGRGGEPVAFRGGRRWERTLEPVPATGDVRRAFRAGGTYLVAGGLGRVGREIARFLADRFQARLALLGRRPLDADAERFLAELRHLGGEARYFSTDVTDPAAVAAAVAAVKADWGPLHGVVQAAVAPYFAPLAQADEAEWLTAVRVKLDGGAALYAATGSEPLDLHVTASSVGAFAAFPGNVGQSAYCAGCTAEEALAGYAAAAGRPARWTAWGVWDHPSLSPAALARLRAAGVHPHATAEGLTALARLASGRDPLTAFGRFAGSVWDAMGGSVVVGPAAAARRSLEESRPVDAPTEDLHAAMDRLARRWLIRALRSEGMGDRSAWAVAPGQTRLADALAEMAARAAADPPAVDPPDRPGLRPALELLERCTAAVPAVLRGERPATDVLFPGGSADLVERVYKEHPVLDRFHRAAAAAVAAARPAVVLEIGAGTGATTGPVLAALAAAGAAVEYVYTDVSPAFLARGRAAFGGPGRRFELLDIERDPVGQGFPPAAADVVLASNVLHATRSVADTLAHAKSLLRPGGRLVLAELTRRDDYATLTFGLLDGWWRFADPAARLPHSPLLSPDGWVAALTAAGFENIEVASAADTPSHSLILAVAPIGTVVAPPPVLVPPPVVAGRTDDPLTAAVRRTIAAGLGLPVERIDPARPYADLGVDSIIAPQLIEQLNAALGVTLRATDLYNHATVEALTAHVRERFGTPPGLTGVQRPAIDEPAPAVSVPTNSDPGDRSNAVAVIGYAGRFPGAPDVDRFWHDLAAGRSAVREVPADRWDVDRVFDPAPGTPGKTYARWGGFLDDFDRFDPLFFNIAPVEAEAMDPQQRVFLEEAWKALEDAGYPPRRLAGGRCGVFVGASANEYRPAGPPGLRTLGGSVAILAARIAYLLDLRGPALPVDTGCSSSLVAVHLACRSLLAGETDLAIAGGVSCSLFTPSVHLYLADARMAAADGKSKTFADAADGFVPAEAAGVLVLKRLDRAVADGDRVHAVIRASGINQDGKTSGITAPSAVSQAALEAEVWRRAGIDPATISYVEAHGTGTKLGDPIEVQALTDAFAKLAPGRGPCRIGSAKTNVGHAMAAAGVVGLIKVLLSLRHRHLPPHLHFDRPNRHIDFASSPFVVNTDLRPWVSSDGGPLRAAVSSFGFSGTNAHLVIEEAPAAPPPPATVGPWVFPVSGQTPEALAARRRELADWLATTPVGLAAVSYTLAVGRPHWRHRAAVVAGTRDELRAALLTDRPGANHPLQSVADAYSSGSEVDWAPLYPGSGWRVVSLPGYPFARDRYWSHDSAGPETVRVHPLLEGGRSDAGGVRYRVRLAATDWVVADHRINGRPLLPGVAFLEVARAAVAAASGRTVGSLRNVAWLRPVFVPADGLTLEIRVRAAGDGWACELVPAEGGPPFATARAVTDSPEPAAAQPLATPGPWRPGDDLYRTFRDRGFEYGPGFRGVVRWAAGPGVAAAEVRRPAAAPASPELRLHPAVLDAALQAAAGIGLRDEASADTYVPSGVDSVDVFAPTPVDSVIRAWAAPPDASGSVVIRVEVLDSTEKLCVRLTGLTARRLTTSPPVGDEAILVRPEWRPATVPAPSPRLPAAVMIVLPPGADPSAWRAAAQRRWPTARLALVEAFGHWEQVEPDHFRLAADDLGHYTRVAERIGCADGWLLIHCSSLTLSPSDPASLRNAIADHRLDAGVAGVRLAVLAALAAAPGTAGTAFAVGPADAGPGVTAAAGLFAVLRQENRHFRGRVVEWDGSPTADAVLPVLAAEVAAGDGAAGRVRYRAGRREAMTWVDVLGSPGMPAWRRGGTYLISGGAGGLGRVVARDLARRAGARLVLLGRRQPDSGVRAVLAELEGLGGDPLYLPADVGRADSVRDAVRRAREQFPTFHGVIHAAGVRADGRLDAAAAGRLAEVAGPKIAGAIHLDYLTRDDPLDVFVSFSSAAAVVGGIGQADYAAANAFLDGFAAWRTRAGRPGVSLSVGWPWWADGGMAFGDAVAAAAAEAGLRPMPADTGLSLLGQALAAGTPHALALYGDRRRLAARLDPPRSEPIPVPGADTEPVLAALRAALGDVIHLAPDKVDVTAPLDRYGIDSVMILRLDERLERDWGPLPKTLLFEYRTLSDLAGYLAANRAGAVARFAPAPVESTPPSAPVPDGLRPDDVAVVGVAGLYPEAADVDEFWANLRVGRDCIREIPPDRWPLDGFFDPDRTNPDGSYSKWGGFVAGADTFDARLFRVAPTEAETIDPQARKFIEVAWAAIEDAGYTRGGLFRPGDPRRAGVFVGAMNGDYQLFGPEEWGKGNPVGPNAAYWNLANRVSYLFDFHGPSVAVDTACSASLTAIHLACEALRRGECQVAVAGGVNLILHPSRYRILSQAGFASSDGRCRSFGAGGDGYTPGEGIGAVVLKPLAAAIADGDCIRGVIRGSAVGHGGKTNGYTVPDPVRQAEVVSAALARAGLTAADIGYVEAHGTGTELGDPIEVAGLNRALAAAPPGTVRVGSVKSNVGHLESAAGVAGLTKVLLQFRHAELAPSLHLETVNPHLALAGGPLRLQTALTPWDRTVRSDGTTVPRRAGVSSFGAGGANAHVILEEPPPRPGSPADDGRPRVLVLSAIAADRLPVVAARFAAALRKPDAPRLADAAFTLQIGREPMPFRVAVVAATHADAADRLERFARNEPNVPDVWTGHADGLAGAVPSDAAPHAAAAAWVGGAVVGWADRPENRGRRRVPLPAYPFAPRRCWIDRKPDPATPRRHPLLGRPTGFAVPLDPDHPLVRDHRVLGERWLPGAVAADLMRAALGAAGTLRDVRWLRPLVVEHRRNLVVEVGDTDVRLVDPVDPGRPFVTADLGAVEPQTPASVELTAVREACPRSVDADELYRLYRTAGVDYGPALRGISRVWVGARTAVAELTSTAGRPPEAVDAGFQLTGVLVPPDAPGRGYVPSAAGRIGWVGPIATHAIATVEHRDADELRLNLTFCDAAGRVVGEVRDFTARAVAPSIIDSRGPVRTLRPIWREAAAAGSAGDGPVLVVGPPREAGTVAATLAPRSVTVVSPDVAFDRVIRDLGPIAEVAFVTAGAAFLPTAEGLRAAEDAGVMPLFRLAKALATSGRLGAGMTLRVVTRGVFGVGDGGSGWPAEAAVIGLARVLANEYPDLVVRVTDIDAEAGDPDLRAALRDPGDPVGGVVAVRGGKRLVRRFEETNPTGLPVTIRPGGLYVIAGGAGGIGLAVGREWAKAGARVVLLGRRPAPRDSVTGLTYRQADVTDPAAVRAVLADARARYGPIRGAVHSALVLRDEPFADMTEAGFREVLDVKARGAVVLADATAADPLDFLAFFSSANSFTANPGQANYAAGCTFQDAFGNWLAAAGRPVRVINWGLWGETGRVATPEHLAAIARLGVFPLSTRQGLDAVGKVLGGPPGQVMVLRATDAVLDHLGRERAGGHGAAAAVGASATATRLAPTVAGPRPDFEPVNEFARAAARRVLADVRPSEVAPGYGRLHAALAEMAGRAGPGDDPDPAVLAARLPTAAAYLKLLTACVARAADVVTGRVPATEVLFPGGSPELVEPVYRGNPLVDFFQHVAAGAVRAAVDSALSLRRDGPVRVIEIGAGTGGTTAAVLPELAGFADRVEYWYTDLSAGLVRHGIETFGPGYRLVRGQVYDVERDPEPQNIPPGGFDVVLAANVLHATKRVADTLARVAALCRPGGVVVVNEGTAAADFNTLTFGLTPGWWAFEDAADRLPHSPFLSADGWERALAAAGFVGVRRFALPHGDSPQHVFVAEATTTPAPAVAPRPEPQGTRPSPSGSIGPVEDSVRRVVASALGLTPDEVEPTRSFADYGTDSILSVRLVRELNAALGIELKPTALFNYPTVRDLAGYVQLEHSRTPVGTVPEPVAAKVGGAKARARDMLDRLARRGQADRLAGAEAAFLERESERETAPAGPPTLEDILRRLEAGEIDADTALTLGATADGP